MLHVVTMPIDYSTCFGKMCKDRSLRIFTTPVLVPVDDSQLSSRQFNTVFIGKVFQIIATILLPVLQDIVISPDSNQVT